MAVHADLVNRGFNTRRGKSVGRQTFYSMIRNPVYKAELDTKLGVGAGDWEPLVETVVWERAQAVMSMVSLRDASGQAGSKSGKRAYRRVREGFELRGSLRCAVCRRRITGGVTKGHRYMNCPEGHVRSRAEALNSGFCKWLASVRPNEIFLRRLEGAVRRELEAERRSLSQRRVQKQRAAATFRAKLQNLNLALADGTMERSAYQATYRELKARLQALEYAGVDDELEQFDVDAVLNFAHRLLCMKSREKRGSPRDSWKGPRQDEPCGLEPREAHFPALSRVRGGDTVCPEPQTGNTKGQAQRTTHQLREGLGK